MSTNAVSKPIQRILLILDFLEELTAKNPDQETFDLRYEDFQRRNKLLDDYDGLLYAFQTISKENEGRIYIREVELKPLFPERQGGALLRPPLRPMAITTHIEDPDDIRQYRNRLESRELSEKKPIMFTLTHKGSKAFLRINDGDPRLVHGFNVGSKRYKLVRYLCDAKDYLPTQDIADRLESDNDSVRGTIDAIRTQISKSLKVERGDVIENSLQKGYRFLNIQIES